MTPGRNDPCPCGSGKKYKKCCAAAPPGEAPGAAASPELAELAALIDGARFAELERKAGDILRRHPDSGRVWKALAIALSMQGNDAVAAWSNAATLLPDDAQVHGSLGDELLRLGRSGDAEASYRRALALDPRRAAVHNNLGNVLLVLGRADEAAASYRQALVLEPDFALARNNLGNALRNAGRYEDAIASYRQALELEPEYAEAHNNLGNACLDAGRLDEAETAYRRAIALQPEIAEAHNNLGNALHSLRRSAEALACYARALALNPRFAVSHSNASDALRDLGRPQDAAASSRSALAIDPALTAAHNSLGNALMDLGQFDAAAASYRRACDADPGFTAAAVNLGIALRLSGATAAAEEHCRRLVERKPDAAAAYIVLAELRADAGHFAEAEALFERAAAIDPQSAEACAGIPHLRRMSVDDAAWLARAQDIAARALPARQEAQLRYALGKFFDDTRDFERAFGEYRRANELQRSYGEPFDRERLTRSVDTMIASYGPQWAERVTAARNDRSGFDDPESRRSVFIVGMPRSGTTLAEQILAAHPAIAGAGELLFWSRAPAQRTAAELGAEYLRLLRQVSPDALRVVDKMPANVWSVGPILEALPHAHLIHMQRHPLDTCLSVYFQQFSTGHPYANELGDLAHYHREYQRLMGHWLAMLPAATILELPYEGLVEDPQAWTRRMLGFIGMPWDARCLDFHESKRSVLTASKWQVRQRINRSSVARWRNYRQFLGPLADLTEPMADLAESAQPVALPASSMPRGHR